MRLWMALARTVAMLSQRLDGALQEALGLTATDKAVLTQLAMAGSPVRMVDLSEQMVVTKAGVTRMVDRLEEMGYVERQPSTEDRRVTHVVITKAGRARWNEAREVLYASLGEALFDRLTAKERVAVTEILERVLQASDTKDREGRGRPA